MNEDEGYLLIDEVAALCRASPETVRFWIKKGRLRSIRPGRRRLIARAELRRFLEEKPRARGR
ncbi:MAG: helix-turn-helix domain-containing protein [Kofleriaceae bacterium]|nr:helix-turn-helix domain-containing protein [Kofleriaceae bacterium]